ncbi:MAG: M48 family metallopeptidase [Desulfomonilaceae bacterium]|nr:M48 family metallopeptidase [Desulfomonilaceae bacterium]
MVDLTIVSVTFVAVYLLQTILCVWLEAINIRHLVRNADKIPDSLKSVIDPGKLSRMNAYTADKSRLFLMRKVVFDALLLALIVSGFLWRIDYGPVLWESSLVLGGIIFFLMVGAGFFILDLPFDYYHTFAIEEKYGFNRSDLQTWVLDHAKGLVLSAIILVALSAPVLWVIQISPNYWWFWAFIIVSCAQLTILVLYPVAIAPIFNKFNPLEDEVLAVKTVNLLNRAGLKAGGVFQMDAGRRSAHSNAFFTGIGRTKRIVLFDTLLASHTHDEILAVLAHEIGHLKLGHVVRSYVYGQVVLLAGFYLTHTVMNWNLPYMTFGFSASQPYVALFLLGVFWQRLGYLVAPVYLAVSRHFERRADEFAADLLRNPEPLSEALKRMASDNLPNLNPHPLYVCFNYSHPPIPERLSLLGKWTAADTPAEVCGPEAPPVGKGGE